MSIRAERVRQRDDLGHFLFGHVNAGMHVGDVSDAQSVQDGRKIRKDQRAARDTWQSFRVPNPVG